MLYTVEVRRVDTELAAAMTEMRGWLDRRGINAFEFDYSRGGPGITFRIGFWRESDALAFAEAFRGRLNDGGDPDGATLWRIAELQT
jgi:hypothetical protein